MNTTRKSLKKLFCGYIYCIPDLKLDMNIYPGGEAQQSLLATCEQTIDGYVTWMPAECQPLDLHELHPLIHKDPVFGERPCVIRRSNPCDQMTRTWTELGIILPVRLAPWQRNT